MSERLSRSNSRIILVVNAPEGASSRTIGGAGFGGGAKGEACATTAAKKMLSIATKRSRRRDRLPDGPSRDANSLALDCLWSKRTKHSWVGGRPRRVKRAAFHGLSGSWRLMKALAPGRKRRQ